MRIAFFGSSLLSAYWNGAATYYRGLLRALAARGHQITFFEPDAYQRQEHRDLDPPPWARVVVYRGDDDGEALRQVELAASADLVVKASGVGVYDALLESAVLQNRRAGQTVIFWDVDAPATLARLRGDVADPFRALLPSYDLIFTYGGGPPVVAGYRALGARECVPIYNGLDPATHRPVPPEGRFAADISFLGNRLPDREARVEEFFLRPAAALPGMRFLLAGSGWGDRPLPPSVRYLGHLYTADHNVFNTSARLVLNVARDSMADVGFSPATRVFEAAGAAACVVTDAWTGLEAFFEPEREILVARHAADVVELASRIGPDRARAIGEAALRRALAEHTYDRRAARVEAALEGRDLTAGVLAAVRGTRAAAGPGGSP
jgi:spore maturation protein CgeB